MPRSLHISSSTHVFVIRVRRDCKGKSAFSSYPVGMSDQDASDEGEDQYEDDYENDYETDAEELRTRVPWAWQELLSVAVLASLALLVLGGLGSGIALISEQSALVAQSPLAWSAVQDGTGWATPYFAIVLLAVVGTVWWARTKWRAEPRVDEDILRHHRRTKKINTAAQFGLALAAFGATLGFVAVIAENLGLGAGLPGTSVDISSGASAAAVLVLATIGVWASARARGESRVGLGAGARSEA
jgi:hypothetical protein